MSVTIEMTPEIETRLQADAAQRGMDTAQYTLNLLQRLYSKAQTPAVTEAERAADWQRLLSFAGSVNSDDPHSADNDRIDADLAREYGSTHEEAA